MNLLLARRSWDLSAKLAAQTLPGTQLATKLRETVRGLPTSHDLDRGRLHDEASYDVDSGRRVFSDAVAIGKIPCQRFALGIPILPQLVEEVMTAQHEAEACGIVR